MDFFDLNRYHEQIVQVYEKEVADAQSYHVPVAKNINCDLWGVSPFSTTTFNAAVKEGRGFQVGSDLVIGYLRNDEKDQIIAVYADADKDRVNKFIFDCFTWPKIHYRQVLELRREFGGKHQIFPFEKGLEEHFPQITNPHKIETLSQLTGAVTRALSEEDGDQIVVVPLNHPLNHFTICLLVIYAEEGNDPIIMASVPINWKNSRQHEFVSQKQFTSLVRLGFAKHLLIGADLFGLFIDQLSETSIKRMGRELQELAEQYKK